MCLNRPRERPRPPAQRPRRGARDAACRARGTAGRRGAARRTGHRTRAPGRGGRRPPARDRAPQAAARQGAPRAVRPLVRARRRARRAARAAARRAGGECGRRRGDGRARGIQEDAAAARRQPPQAGPPSATGEPAPRADRLSRALRLPEGRRPGQETGRGRDRDPRVRAALVEGGRARAGEGQLPGLRGGQPPAGPPPPARPRAVRAAKSGQPLPLTRQSAIYAGEGVELDVSTLADWVGASAAGLMPLVLGVRARVFSAARLHGDDTTVPVLAKGRTRIGRVWGYVRDDRPFGGPDPPAVAFFYSPDRRGEHPERHLASFAGILQADAYAGFDRLYDPEREPGPILEAACWAHARRKLFEIAAVSKAPVAAEAVGRIDELFAIEREINGRPAGERLAVRKERTRPLVGGLEAWLRVQHARVSPKPETGKAVGYALNHWKALTRFLEDGRICMSNNAAERALRGVAVGRKNWTFAGSDRGGERAAAIYTLVETCKLNGVDPQAWLADVLARLPDHP